MAHDQAILEYLGAIRSREAVRKKLSAFLPTLKAGVAALEELVKMKSAGSPGVQIDTIKPFADQQSWPTAKAIADARSELVRACDEADQAWNKIPPENRVGLNSPAAAG